eukprot:6426897-Pyramimonas_sp.AAC.1
MVAVYNVTRRQVEWCTEGGHTETIFDCAFKTDDPNILATASFDRCEARQHHELKCYVFSFCDPTYALAYRLTMFADGVLNRSTVRLWDIRNSTCVSKMQVRPGRPRPFATQSGSPAYSLLT